MAEKELDIVIVGAGFAGIRALYEARQLEMSAIAYEAGTDVGGTWYWNRYPGARTDTEAWGYMFPFDKDLLEEWNWSERFPRQPEVEKFLQHMTERYDLRKDMQFRTRVESAHYDEDANRWTVKTDQGDTIVCKYFITASGILSSVIKPPFPGIDGFQGEWYQTARWPKEKVSFAGKRVALIGAGATAVQALPVIAHTADQVTMFQRTPNYVMPSRNRLLDDDERADIRANYDAWWHMMYNQFFGFPIDANGRMSTDVSTDEEYRQVFDAAWESGGFRYIFESFDDLLTDQTCNDRGSEYVRNKIRALVKDPETAEKLCPKNYPVGGKRPPLGHHYYETFNRDNVSLVSVLDNAIADVTPTGLKMADGTEYEFDMIIFAMGFDAITGAMTAMDIRGRGGRTIAEEWEGGAQATLGLASPGFPNMFMIFGPGSPASNLPPIIHQQSEWVGNLIRHAQEQGNDVIETTPEACDAFGTLCREIFEATLLYEGSVAGRAWWNGANVDGKVNTPLFYFGGVPGYIEECDKEVAAGYPGFKITTASPVS